MRCYRRVILKEWFDRNSCRMFISGHTHSFLLRSDNAVVAKAVPLWSVLTEEVLLCYPLNSWGNLCGESQYLTSTPPRGSWDAIKLASQAPTVYMEHVNSRQHSRGDRTGQLPVVTAWNLIILMWKKKTKAVYIIVATIAHQKSPISSF